MYGTHMLAVHVEGAPAKIQLRLGLFAVPHTLYVPLQLTRVACYNPFSVTPPTPAFM